MVTIGVTQWSLDRPGAEALHQAAGLGFAAIHIDAGEVGGEMLLDDAGLRDRYRQAAEDTGVQIRAIAPGYLNDYGPVSPAGSDNARKCRDIIRIAIDAAVDLSVPLVFLPSFRAGEIRDERDLARSAEVLQEACDYAAGRPLALATENTLDAAGNLKLLEAVSRPNLYVLLDMQNPPLWGHDAAGLVRAVWPRLIHQVHAKDGTGGQMGNALLGEGEGHFLETAHTLRSLGFDGAVISENDYHGRRSANAARDIEAMIAAFK
jgi:sugar phosphate isomerase/epimerase